MGLLDMFFKDASVPSTAVAVEPVIDRKAELLAEIKSLDQDLSAVTADQLAFCNHNYIFTGTRMAMIVPSGGDPGAVRQAVEAEWRSLNARRDEIMKARNVVLAELARL